MLKKFFFVLFFILFFLILFNIDLFAVDVTFIDQSGTEITTSLPDLADNSFAIVQAGSNIILISTTTDFLQLYFTQTSRIYTNYYGRLYCDIYYYNSSSNIFTFSSNYFRIDGSTPSSFNFSVLYCSTDFYVLCEQDENGIFNDGELLGYDSNVSLDITYQEFDGFYRLYTNYFTFDGIQSFFTAYIWIGDGTYIPLEECDPISGSGWESFDNYESNPDDDSKYRWYYDVTIFKQYKICFENSLSGTYMYFDIDLSKSYFLNLHLSTTEHTTEPIYVLSNRYYFEGDYDISQDFLQNYSIEIAYRFR